MRITIACPDSLKEDANQLAAILGNSLADTKTFYTSKWFDKDNNLYAVASFETDGSWIEKAQMPLYRPDWDTNEKLDLVKAENAQNLVVFWDTQIEEEQQKASTDKILAIGGMKGLDAIESMGLSNKNDSEEYLD